MASRSLNWLHTWLIADTASRNDEGCALVIQRQQAALITAFAQDLKPHKHAALVGFPAHENKGDAAIWIGEKILLASLGIKTVYEASWSNFRCAALDNVIEQHPDLVILLHGGGNFGDLYAWEMEPRLSIIEHYPNHPIRFLPQSIHFEDPVNLAKAIAILAQHSDLKLYVRDKVSLAFARKNFGKEGILIR